MSAPGRKVWLVHVPYRQPGGEDVHVEVLQRAYLRLGYQVTLLPGAGAAQSPLSAVRSLWPADSSPQLDEALRSGRPDFIHLHNAFPAFGPRLFRWVEKQQVPLVMTVHNHRLFCTNGLALRQGRECEDCLASTVAWRPLLHKCNGDWTRTVYHSLALTQLRREELFTRAVSRFIAPSPYVEQLLSRLGVPAGRVSGLLHPVEGPPVPDRSVAPRHDLLFAGRLSAEKGIGQLLEAARLRPQRRLVIVGDGPERPAVERACRLSPSIQYLGPQPHPRVLELLGQSRAAVVPSQCKETVSLLALEAAFMGTPCVLAASESNRWLAAEPRLPMILASDAGPAALVEALDRAWSTPPLDPAQLEEVRAVLGFDRFCTELAAIASRV